MICGSILAFRSPKSASGIFCHLLPFYSKKKMQNTPDSVDLLQDTACGGHCTISDDVHDCKAPQEEPELAISKILATQSRDQKREPKIEFFELFLKSKKPFRSSHSPNNIHECFCTCLRIPALPCFFFFALCAF